MKIVRWKSANPLNRRFLMSMVALFCGMTAQANLKTNDVTRELHDRYTTSCDVRDQFDLYQFGHVVPELSVYTQKIRPMSDENQGTAVYFNKLYFYNIPISKIEYVLLPEFKRQQTLYLDVTSMTAKQHFSQIKFHHGQGLDISKIGRFIVVKCVW